MRSIPMALRVLAPVLLATLGGAGNAVGQSSGDPYAVAYLPECDSGHAIPVDTTIVTLVLRPTAAIRGKEVPVKEQALAREVAAALAEFYKAPASVALPQPQGWYRRPSKQGDYDPLPGSTAEIVVRLTDRGRGAVLAWEYGSDSRELNRALEEAVWAADSAGTLAGIMSRRDAHVVLSLAGVDSVLPDDMPLTRLRVTYYPLEQPVVPLSYPAPQYPPDLQRRGVGGRVRVRYIVASNGRVVPATLRFEDATDSAFVEPARQALLGARFSPARGSGCALPVSVRQAISFKIGD